MKNIICRLNGNGKENIKYKNLLSAPVNCDMMNFKKFFIFLRKQSNFLFDVQRLGVVSNSLVAAMMSYERYILVCRPFEYQRILSNRRRLVNYLIMIVLLLMVSLLFVTESVFRRNYVVKYSF